MNFKLLTGAVAAVAMSGAAGSVLAQADLDAKLIVEGEIEMITRAPAPDHMEGMREIYSGWLFRSPETQALQMDDFENPAMIFVDQAATEWQTAMGTEDKSCASCHGDVADEMVGVRAVYPKWNEDAGEVRTLAMQIDACRTENMGAEPYGIGSAKMVNMEALISSVSRGLPINVAIDGPAAETWEKGKELYYTRFGQLEMSCANCHEDNYDNMIRADHLSQGQINGFPVYRFNTTNIVSTHNRFRGCIRDTRAETFAMGSPEFIALELYVASRGNGLSVEAPSVRQ